MAALTHSNDNVYQPMEWIALDRKHTKQMR